MPQDSKPSLQHSTQFKQKQAKQANFTNIYKTIQQYNTLHNLKHNYTQPYATPPGHTHLYTILRTHTTYKTQQI